jgi:hypothetical protein
MWSFQAMIKRFSKHRERQFQVTKAMLTDDDEL